MKKKKKNKIEWDVIPNETYNYSAIIVSSIAWLGISGVVYLWFKISNQTGEELMIKTQIAFGICVVLSFFIHVPALIKKFKKDMDLE